MPPGVLVLGWLDRLGCLARSLSPSDRLPRLAVLIARLVFVFFVFVRCSQAAFRLGVTTPAVMSSVLVPVLLRGLGDQLPNVRLTAARVADDILSVAALSSWPPPGGRARGKGQAREEEMVSGGEGDGGGGGDAERSPDAALQPAICGGGEGDGDGGVDNFVVVTAEAAGGSGGVRGGDWWGWGCGWEEVERKLEAVSAGDPDRDAAYFATQALKPKWAGDSSTRV